MACPVCVGGGAFLALTGVYSVFFKDRRYRRVWWTGLLLITLGWVSYFTVLDRGFGVRVGLEVASVLFAAVILWRLRQLMRMGLRPPGTVAFAKAVRVVTPYTLNPLTVMLKTFILTMVFFELIGMLSLSWQWYLWSSVLLVGWMVALHLLVSRGVLRLSRGAVPGPNGRKSGQDESGCPFGFTGDKKGSK